jgi:hypothetical protein
MVSASSGKQVRLPVKFRYRSPVVFEFHVAGKRGASAYAQIWLQHLTDNEETPIDIPIWTTKYGNRLTQNYITERNYKEVPSLDDIEEVGRLQFRGRFKAGMDECHKEFIVDNDARETFETWEACLAEGVRARVVEADVPERVQTLHEESLTQGRDVLQQASPEEKKLWLTKSGTDWSGAFGEDPKAYTDSKGRKIAEPGKDKPPHDLLNSSGDEDNELDDDDDDDDDSSSSSDLGIKDASSETGKPSMDTTRTRSTSCTNWTSGSNTDGSDDRDHNKANKRTERRKQRGLMQWKPARNAAFAKDEAKFGFKKLQKKLTGGLSGREPQVETEV